MHSKLHSADCCIAIDWRRNDYQTCGFFGRFCLHVWISIIELSQLWCDCKLQFLAQVNSGFPLIKYHLFSIYVFSVLSNMWLLNSQSHDLNFLFPVEYFHLLDPQLIGYLLFVFILIFKVTTVYPWINLKIFR